MSKCGLNIPTQKNANKMQIYIIGVSAKFEFDRTDAFIFRSGSASLICKFCEL